MRLHNYILEYANYKKIGRGKEISEEQALKLAPKFSQAILSILKGNPYILRYINNNMNYYLIDPKKGEERKSANTFNYYTLIMDNSKRWSKYPKRSKSIICITENKNKFNSPYYLVLLKNGSILGECSGRDLWVSFKNIKIQMLDWSEQVNKILKMPYLDKDKNTYPQFDKNIITFKKSCENFDKWFKSSPYNEKYIKYKLRIKSVQSIDWFNDWNGEPIYNYFDKLLDPKTNGFKLKNVFNLSSDDEHEVWSDSESLMIYGYENSLSYIQKAKDLI